MHRIPSSPQAFAATPAPRGRPEKQFKIGERLSMNDLSLVTKDLANETTSWSLLGVYIGVSPAKLNEIENSEQSDPISKKFQRGLEKWLQTETTPNWSMVIAALKSEDYNALAQTLLTKYGHIQTNTLTNNDLSTLELELDPVAPDWYQFCMSLGVSMPDLGVIDAKKGQDDFLRETLASCIDSEKGLTYEKIFEALKSLGNNLLISQLRAKRITC